MDNLEAGKDVVRAPRSGTAHSLVGDFVTEIERIIALLGTQRFLRISLFRFKIDGLPSAAAVELVDEALKPHGVTGALPDGSVGFLYLGPRGKGLVADLALVHHISERLRGEIQRLTPFHEMRLTSVLASHRWADEVIDACDLIESLHRPTVESQAC